MSGRTRGRRSFLAACAGGLVACALPERGGGGVRLWIAGDVHLGGGGADRIAALAAAMPAGAIGVVNLEGPIGGAGEWTEVGDPARPRLVNGPGTAAALAACGVRAAGIANNHAGDLGPGGAAGTAAALRAGGVAPFGGPAGAATLTGGGVRVALTAHDLGGGGPREVAAAVAAAGAGADVVIAAFHVTGPPSYLPAAALREAVEAALAAGAAAAVSHGSHAVARVEARGRRVIAWGLGNVAFDCRCTDEIDAIALDLRIGRGGIEAAAALAIDAGIAGAPARLAADPGATFDLLEALGSSAGRRDGHRFWFMER